MVNRLVTIPSYLSFFKVYNNHKLVIKYREFVRISVDEDYLPKKTDVDA